MLQWPFKVISCEEFDLVRKQALRGHRAPWVVQEDQYWSMAGQINTKCSLEHLPHSSSFSIIPMPRYPKNLQWNTLACVQPSCGWGKLIITGTAIYWLEIIVFFNVPKYLREVIWVLCETASYVYIEKKILLVFFDVLLFILSQ